MFTRTVCIALGRLCRNGLCRTRKGGRRATTTHSDSEWIQAQEHVIKVFAFLEEKASSFITGEWA